jgi:hypothetical protein
MPANTFMPGGIPEPFDYSPNIEAGRQDLQADGHRFFADLFPPPAPPGPDPGFLPPDPSATGIASILDVGAGLGASKARMGRARTTTYDVDPRLASRVDLIGAPGAPLPRGPLPDGRFDAVTSFDVIEHVEDDATFLRAIRDKAARAAFVTTPNWHINKCRSTHHWREYTPHELMALAAAVWPLRDLTLLAFYKDAEGGWWEYPREGLPENLRRRHGLLWISRDAPELRARLIPGVPGQPQRTPA